MKYADLHIHSNYSDGVKSPEEIIDSAIKDNIKYISIKLKPIIYNFN